MWQANVASVGSVQADRQGEPFSKCFSQVVAAAFSPSCCYKAIKFKELRGIVWAIILVDSLSPLSSRYVSPRIWNLSVSKHCYAHYKEAGEIALVLFRNSLGKFI